MNDVLLLVVARCEAFAGRSTSAVEVVLLVAADVGPSTNDDDPALALEIVDDLPLTLAETAGPTADDSCTDNAESTADDSCTDNAESTADDSCTDNAESTADDSCTDNAESTDDDSCTDNAESTADDSCTDNAESTADDFAAVLS